MMKMWFLHYQEDLAVGYLILNLTEMFIGELMIQSNHGKNHNIYYPVIQHLEKINY